MKCKENIKSHIERNSELQGENEALKQKETQKTEEIECLQVTKNHLVIPNLLVVIVVIFCRKCIGINYLNLQKA